MAFYRNLSLREKLLSLCIFMAVLMSAIASCGYVGLQKVQFFSSKISDEALPSLSRLDNMFLNYRALRINLRTLGIPGLTKQQEAEAIAHVHEAIDDYEVQDKAYRQVPFIEGQKELYDAVNNTWNEFKEVGSRALKYQASGEASDREKLHKIFLEDCPKAAKTYTLAVDKLKAFHAEEANAATEAAKAYSRSANLAMISLSSVGIILGMLFGYILSSKISSTIIAVVHSLNESSSHVSQASSEIAVSSESLSQATAEQAASLQETAASLEEITAMITKASDSANSTAERSSESEAKAAEGQKSMRKMLSSMQEINEANDSIRGRVTESNEKLVEILNLIEEISSKTKVINEIVFQTKLLSFNASVEAARAGENGKGFAVVAEEIGTLAQMSGKAAKEIATLVEGSTSRVNTIIAETKSSVDEILARGKEKVSAGVAVAGECSTMLNTIVQNVNAVSRLSQEIASASREQSQGVGEINKAMGQLDTVTQNNALASQQTSASAEDLAKQSGLMRSAVGELSIVVFGRKRSTSRKTVASKMSTRQSSEDLKDQDLQNPELTDVI